MQQLNLMSLIYGCATITVIAMTGNHTDAGLPGISFPRLAQVKESIGGYGLFTTPVPYTIEEQEATYSNRAWTLQEYLLSTRRLICTESTAAFVCHAGQQDEDIDYTTLPARSYAKHPAHSTFTRIYGAEPVSETSRYHDVAQD